MIRTRGRRLWLAVVLLLAVPLASAAHSGATGIVKERMDAMKDIGRATKLVAAMFQGKQPYDAAAVRSRKPGAAGPAASRDAMPTPLRRNSRRVLCAFASRFDISGRH